MRRKDSDRRRNRGFLCPLVEHLEPRLLLDATGPSVVDAWPGGLVVPGADYVEVTFNEPIDPATFTADDVSVIRRQTEELSNVPAVGPGMYVEAAGTLAFLGEYSHGVRIVDVSNPASPVEVGFYGIEDSFGDMDAVGSKLYLADGSMGLLIIDVSDPTAPTKVGSYNTPGYAYDVDVVGSVAYVADGSGGLCIIDVSDPTHPSYVNSLDTPGSAEKVDVAGTTACVMDDDKILRFFDVSEPTAMVEVGHWRSPNNTGGVHIVGVRVVDTPLGDTLAYVAESWGGLRILNVSDPTAPVEVGSYAIWESSAGLDVDGHLAYLAAYSDGLRVIDVSNPAAPVEVGLNDTEGSARAVKASGSLAFVADYDSMRIMRVGRDVVDVSQVDSTTYRVGLDGPLGDGEQLVYVGPDITDLDGNAMDQDGDGIGGEHWDDRYLFTFRVDATPPSAPGGLAVTDDNGTSASDGITNDDDLVFSWRSVSDWSGIDRYEYRVDAGEWVATTDRTAEMTLAEGSHALEVRATDGLGQVGAASALEVLVDLTAPIRPKAFASKGRAGVG